MDTIITYLFEKGGILGIFLIFAILWILYRETYYYQSNKNSNKSGQSQDPKSEVDKILYIVEDLKTKKDEWATKSDLDKLIDLIEKMNNAQDDTEDKLAEIEDALEQISILDKDATKKIQELWSWHSVFDNEGVPVWYVRKSLEESIDNLDFTVSNLQDKCIQVNDVLKKDLISQLQKVNDDRISELKELLEAYNKTVTDLIVTLEKLKTVIKSESGE